LRAPHVHEIAARELRRFVAAAEIGDMAAGAARLIGRAARRGLRGRIRGLARWLLGRYERDRAHPERGERNQTGLHRLVS
jgi:hypothetical protein